MADTKYGYLVAETVDGADSFLVSKLVFPNGSLQLSEAESAEVDFGSGTGDVVGPASAVNDRVAVFDGTTGKLIKDGGATIGDIVAGVGAAPLSATYITQTPNATLTNEFAMSALATGLVKNTTGTGVPTIAVAGTDYLTPTGNGSGLTNLNGANLTDNSVSLAKLADIATASFLGRNTPGTGDPEVLSIATAKTMLNLSGTNSGDVTLAGETYLSIAGQVITANSINLSGSHVTSTLPVARGGTGATSFTANGVLYGNTTSALQVTAQGGANTVLIANAGAPSFSAAPVIGTSITVPLITTLSSGNLTIAPTGSVTFDPTGNQIDPLTNYDLNLGQLSKKYLTLHAAELWVETLVAQDTIATIGGRILVGPTTVLTSDLASGATSIIVKHNQMINGDRVYLESNGKVEFLAITSAPSGTGPYTYTVTRNLDGTGANDWFAGDAVFNTGQTGNGFIDLYSVRGVKTSSQAGPTIVGNVRNSSTYNDWSERWAIGNLNGLYGYGTNIYGVAMGVPTAAWVKIDPTNGVRIGHNTTTLTQIDASGNASFTGTITASAGSIAGWTINTGRLSSGTTYLASGFDPPAGQVAWFGKTAGTSQGWFLRDSSGRFITAGVGGSAPTFPYMAINDGTNFRVVIGGLDDTFNGGPSVSSMGMKIWNSSGTKLVEFSNSVNEIAGWSLTNTKFSSTGIDLHSGASAGLAFGATPPTSASAGTGIWLDRTGLYGLNSDVVQAKINASDGKFTAGAGNVTLDANGISIAGFSTSTSKIKWIDTQIGEASIYGSDAGAGEINVQITSKSASTGTGGTVRLSTANSDESWQTILNVTSFPGDATVGGASLVVQDNSTAVTSDLLKLNHRSTGTPAAGFGSGVRFLLESSTTNDRDAAQISSIWTTATDASRSAAIVFQTVNNATGLTERARIGQGLQVGSPTGGDKGAGTINVSVDIYKNNSAYGNPDFVFEHWATGKIEKFADKEGASEYAGLRPLSELREFVRSNYHLPGFGQKAGLGLFSGGDQLLLTVEQAYLYIFELEQQIKELKGM